MLERIGLKFLHTIDAELAHNIALQYLRFTTFQKKQKNLYPKLKTKIAGIELPNPVGLAAGFDKNAVALKSLSQIGFGFTEIGAVTPQPQSGNPKPRAFRIKSQKAIVNHYGFNNDGMLKVNKRLAKFSKKSILGLNIGANKYSSNMVSDFIEVLACCTENIHFATINISSPNTKNLRDLQSEKHLNYLLSSLTNSDTYLSSPIPIFIKISPDLNYKQLEHIVALAKQYKIAGIIATNSSTDYRILKDKEKFYKGGVSGQPLFTKSTKILAQLSVISEGKIALIGVGGISSGKDAFEKVCAGASAVQLYSALTFNGTALLSSILRDLNNLVEDNGFNHISEAVGIKKDT